MNTNATSQRGLTLVEIMIALTISLLLIAGTIQIWVNTKQTYRVGDALSRIQENGRFAIEFMAHDLRMAGNWGCAKPDVVKNNLNNAGGVNFGGGALAGMDGAAGAADSITVRGAFGAGIKVQPPFMTSLSSDVQIPAGNKFKQNDIVLVSDCASADLFQATNTNPGMGQLARNAGAGSPGNAVNELQKLYKGNATVYEARQITYSVGVGADGQPTLFRSVNGKPAEEVAGGVENMQITYGEDTSGDGASDYYVDAANVKDMNDVVSVRVSLLLRSGDDNLATKKQTYKFNGQTTVAPDRRLRHVFTTTVLLRNRTL
jgi:type IV pilus assembly protein PilW